MTDSNRLAHRTCRLYPRTDACLNQTRFWAGKRTDQVILDSIDVFVDYHKRIAERYFLVQEKNIELEVFSPADIGPLADEHRVTRSVYLPPPLDEKFRLIKFKRKQGDNSLIREAVEQFLSHLARGESVLRYEHKDDRNNIIEKRLEGYDDFFLYQQFYKSWGCGPFG